MFNNRLRTLLIATVLVLCIFSSCFAQNEEPSGGEQNSKEKHNTPENVENAKSEENSGDDATVTTEEDSQSSKQHNEEKAGEYGAGSLCVYCKYCKFCKLCKKDCPCKKSKKRPNCHLCKYCSYCYLCTSACETFCQPGSFIDTISSAIYSALPKFDNKMKDEVNKDIESAKDWIKSYL